MPRRNRMVHARQRKIQRRRLIRRQRFRFLKVCCGILRETVRRARVAIAACAALSDSAADRENSRIDVISFLEIESFREKTKPIGAVTLHCHRHVLLRGSVHRRARPAASPQNRWSAVMYSRELRCRTTRITAPAARRIAHISSNPESFGTSNESSPSRSIQLLLFHFFGGHES